MTTAGKRAAMAVSSSTTCTADITDAASVLLLKIVQQAAIPSNKALKQLQDTEKGLVSFWQHSQIRRHPRPSTSMPLDLLSSVVDAKHDTTCEQIGRTPLNKDAMWSVLTWMDC